MVEHNTKLDAVFHSLADPTRRDILRRVSRRTLTVGEVARLYERQLSLAAVSKHLMVLERAGLVRKRRHGREQQVELSPKALRDAGGYLERYREAWEGRLGRLDKFLKDTK